MKGKHRLLDSSYDALEREWGMGEKGLALAAFFIFKEADVNMVKY